MAVILPHALIRGLSLARRADLAESPEEKAELRGAAVAALQSIAAPEHKTPSAAYEIGLMAFLQAQETMGRPTLGRHSQITKIRRDLKAAIDYYNIAAGMPDHQRDHAPAKALEALAQLHETGLMVQGQLVGLRPNQQIDSEQFDYQTAVTLREQAASLGLFDSQVQLGIAYFTGCGTQTSLKDAFKWFCRASDNVTGQSAKNIADVDAMIQMTLEEMNDEQAGVKKTPSLTLIHSPELTRQKRLREGAVWLKIANHEKDQTGANRTDFDHACAMAISLFEPYAGLEQKEPSAAYHLGLTYYVMAVEADGDLALAPDERHVKIENYLVKAAQNFNVVMNMPPKAGDLVHYAAADALARVYENDDIGADKRLWQRILSLRTMAAQGGGSEAQYTLADNYFNGKHATQPDLKKARRWINRALQNEMNPLQSDVIDGAKKLEAKIARAEKWVKRGWTPDQPKVLRLPVAAKQAVP